MKRSRQTFESLTTAENEFCIRRNKRNRKSYKDDKDKHNEDDIKKDEKGIEKQNEDDIKKEEKVKDEKDNKNDPIKKDLFFFLFGDPLMGGDLNTNDFRDEYKDIFADPAEYTKLDSDADETPFEPVNITTIESLSDLITLGKSYRAKKIPLGTDLI